MCSALLCLVDTSYALLFVRHARPISCLPAHAAPRGRASAMAPAPSRKCPTEHRCRLAARASNTVHHALSPSTALNSQRSRLPLCPLHVHPCHPCPDCRGREPLPVHATRAPRVPGHGSASPGSCCAPLPTLVVGPSRGASVPAGAPCGQQRAGLRCVAGPARSARR